MILVDTNVWSEQLKLVRNTAIVAWMNRNSDQLVLSSIVLGELQLFVAKQDDGQRKRTMADLLAAIVAATRDRFVGFGLLEATAYGELMARMRRAGTPLPLIDGWIAAQASAHGLSIATRNTSDFWPTGVELIDPWSA